MSGSGRVLIHYPTSKVFRKTRKSSTEAKKKKNKKDNNEFNAANGIRKAGGGTFMETCHDVIHYLIDIS